MDQNLISETRSYLLMLNYFKKLYLQTHLFEIVAGESKNIQLLQETMICLIFSWLLEEQLNSQVHILKRQYHNIAKWNVRFPRLWHLNGLQISHRN